MITDKDLIRRALLGDQEAQAQCTEKGIMLPCPICGGEIKIKQCDWDMFYPYCDGCKLTFNFLFDSEKDAIEIVNTRPATPIGRCGECKNWNGGDCYRQELTKSNDFCSYFEPKEEE